MTLVVHDFSGHPFQVELSRRLADLGHDVEHRSAAQHVSGKGHLDRQAGDSRHLRFVSSELNLPFQKYAPWGRIRWELAYGRAWVRDVRRQKPTAVIASNVPLLALWVFVRHARRTHIPWILWHQDIYSHRMSAELAQHLPAPVARAGARFLRWLEGHVTRSAQHVVAIGEAFTPVYAAWGVAPERVSVIPNWAPLSRIYPVGRVNRRSGLLFPRNPDLRLVYAGTLGRRHHPDLLPDLVERVRAAGIDASMVVVSQGDGARDVAQTPCAAAGHLEVFDFQSADHLPDVLGSGDVLIALLEPDATTCSIPSKVLSYMAAGRPILGLMPSDNPAAIDITATGGLVVAPDSAGVGAAAAWLVELAGDHGRRTAIGIRTRHLAEERFDAETVAYRFADIIASITGGGEASTGAPEAKPSHLA